MGEFMKVRWRYWMGCVFAGVLSMALAAAASAQVVVTVDGDTANATISLTDNNGVTYDADVTIVFDSPGNLTPQALNLTAELVDPADVNPRLRNDGIGIGQSNCGLLNLFCPTVDPAFPVMITVEPLDLPWLFSNGFDGGSDGSGVLSFLNTYQIDVHTHDLTYTDNSKYRLYKAPVDSDFHDVTNDVTAGSVRVRGRGGDFSQFVVATDPRDALTVSLQKIVELNLRIVAAAISDGLRLDLLALLAKIDTLVLIDVIGALAALDELIDLIDENAGTNIANIWTAHRDVVNDAGEMSELARTLRFSMTRILSGGTPNP